MRILEITSSRHEDAEEKKQRYAISLAALPVIIKALGPKQQLPGLKQGLLGPKQALLGPKQGAVLLDQLASKYKRPGRKGLRGGQSYPKKHYSGLEGLCW